jgi:exopolyphosphatase/guanosine-5'-triphosphate,3'-diphosphate pyrophosphatase
VTLVGAIDCGTNTIKLLVADLDPTKNTLHDRFRTARMVRLGQGVDATGRLADEALVRAFAALDEYAAILKDYDLDALRFCATSAARDASNAAVFQAGVLERLGVEAEVVPGAEEAALSYDGATRELPGLPGPVLVVDIGGGSTELILGDGHGHVIAAHSLDIGSVRMHERHAFSDPPTPAEIEEATAQIDAGLDRLAEYGVQPEVASSMVGVAGTVTTMAAMVLDLPGYDRDRIHHADLPVAAVHEAVQRILAMTVAERKTLPFLHPGRADVIGAGALILDRVLRRLDGSVTTLHVSESDILDGIAWSLLPRGQFPSGFRGVSHGD